MPYPKKIMTIKELHTECGYPEEMLRAIYRSRAINKKFSVACKQDESKQNSPILFDTDNLQKYWESRCNGV